MHHSVLRALENLPPLDVAAARRPALTCKICGDSASLFDVVDLQKHCSQHDPYSFGLSGIQVPYFRCGACGFLFTHFLDDWTNEDFARFVYNSDYWRVDPEYRELRPLRFAKVIAGLLGENKALRILDYGSGSGEFGRQLCAHGFSTVESYDPFSSPTPPTGDFDVVTCLEVLEHTCDPRASVAAMQALMRPGGVMIFSQTVQPLNIETLRAAWWYLAPRNGHVSMFSLETLLQLLPTPKHSLRGNGWLWAIVPPAPPASLQAAVLELGPRISIVYLPAPHGGDDDMWHAAEDLIGLPFRWSRSDTLSWTVTLPETGATLLDLHIPLALQVRDGFASESIIEVNGEATTHAVTANRIRAQATVVVTPGAKVHVALRTPPPCSPFLLRGAPDARPLGLAIQCSPIKQDGSGSAAV